VVQRSKARNWRRPVSWLLGGALLIIVAYYVIRAFAADARAPVRLVVYAFSTQEAVFTEGVFPAFEQEWEAKSGRALTVEGVFGASGTLAGQINLGAPADVAVFSNAKQVDWLRLGKRISRRTEPVVVGCTPMVIATRPGNPLQVAGYPDLARSGLRLLHADPSSSGAGEWAVLAEYGSTSLVSNSREAGKAQLAAIWRNVWLLPDSARSAMSLFELGAGDALVTYEQDALLAQQRGVELEVVIPSYTIAAEHVAVIVDDNVTRAERPVAEAFVRLLLSDTGQEILGRYRLRPPSCQSSAFVPLDRPFTVDQLGGWSKAYADLVEGIWQKEIEPGLDLDPSLTPPTTGER